MSKIESPKRLRNRTMFIGLGAQKAGTTWLHEYLTDHPEIYMSPIKELHVFDHRHVSPVDHFRSVHLERAARLAQQISERKGQDSQDDYDRLTTSVLRAEMVDRLDKYLEYFAHRIEEQRVFGEITPAYSLLPARGYSEILSLTADVKFVFILRDPFRRAWSHINDEYRRKHIEADDATKLAKITDSTALDDNAYFQKSNYQKTIETLESVVDRENILYLFYEELFEEQSVRALCRFLRIGYRAPRSFDTIVNKGSYNTSQVPEAAGIASIYDPVYAFCRAKFGAALPRDWQA